MDGGELPRNLASKSIIILWHIGQEKEDFHNVELVYLLQSLPPTMIVRANSTASCRRRTA